MIADELMQAYIDTNFQVPELGFVIKIGKSHRLLDKYLSESLALSWAFITAWNPHSLPLTQDENYHRNDLLLADIHTYRYFKGLGVGPDPNWQPEESFLIVGIDKESAITLGRKYNQNAIVFGKKGERAELLVIKY